MYPCLDNWVAIERAVVYFARAAHVFCAGIKCRYSKQIISGIKEDTCIGVELIKLLTVSRM